MSSIDQHALDLIMLRSYGPMESNRLLVKNYQKHHKKAQRMNKKIPGFQKMATDLLKRDPQYAWRLCEARRMLGHYEDHGGWEFRSEVVVNYWMNQPYGPPWDGKPTEKLYLFGEQGIGDEILFSQCIPDAIEALGHRNIVLDTDERLIPIFERSFGITCIPREPLNSPKPGMTAWMFIGDLMRLFRPQKWNGKPYLKADPKRVEEFSWAQGQQAISWSGRHGSYPVEDLVRMVGTGIDVQYNADSELLVQPRLDKRNDLEGLAGLLSNVSRLVSVSTSVVHLCAALGTKVELVLAPFKREGNIDQLQWRWPLIGSRTPWYDSVTISRSLKELRARLHVFNSR